MFHSISWVLALVVCSHAETKVTQDTPVMALEEVRPGMQGVWKTAVRGAQVESFAFEVIGIADNFIGPGKSVILARALDTEQIHIGPVAGMSGSPCYIDGRLIGAYAYGFTWPKDQALFGITPTHDMFRVLENGNRSATGTSTGTRVQSTARGHNAERYAHYWKAFFERSSAFPHAQDGSAVTAVAFDPLPTPLLSSGLAESALRSFAPDFRALGFEIMSAPAGTASHLNETHLVAGAPVGALLVDGDFRMAAVGTLTWRKDNQVLAFGHPFLNAGDVEVPMAPAEVLTVVQTMPLSFKLANVGEPVGAFLQDRLTTVAGEVGRKAAVTRMEINLSGPDKAGRQFTGNLFQDPQLTPLLSAVALFSSLSRTLETAGEQTFYLDVECNVQGHPPLVLRDAGYGNRGAMMLAMRVRNLLGILLNNPYEPVRMESLKMSLRVVDGIEHSRLHSLRMTGAQPRAGGVLDMAMKLERYRNESGYHPLSIPIADDLAGATLRLVVADAATAHQMESGDSGKTIGNLSQLLEFLSSERSSNAVYVTLMRPAEGLGINGTRLLQLPPSAQMRLDSDRTRIDRETISEAPAWEIKIKTDDVFTGSYSMPISIAP